MTPCDPVACARWQSCEPSRGRRHRSGPSASCSEPEARDRAAVIDLFASPEVGTYIGGSQPRDVLERAMPDIPRRRPGHFVVERDAAMIGTVTLERSDREHPARSRSDSGEVELGYLFLPHAWGRGYASEACAAALDWLAGALPGEPVLLCTQTANERSMRLAATLGFGEVARFKEYGAEQWLGVRLPVTGFGDHTEAPSA